MVYRRSLWSLCSLLTVIALLSFAKSSIIANNTAVRSPDAGSKCHVYNTYNYYNSHLNTGSNKKMEALLHRVLNELSEIREEITLLKANKTTGKYVYKECAPTAHVEDRSSLICLCFAVFCSLLIYLLIHF